MMMQKLFWGKKYMSRRLHNPPNVILSGKCKTWHHKNCKKLGRTESCQCHCHREVLEGFLW